MSWLSKTFKEVDRVLDRRVGIDDAGTRKAITVAAATLAGGFAGGAVGGAAGLAVNSFALDTALVGGLAAAGSGKENSLNSLNTLNPVAPMNADAAILASATLASKRRRTPMFSPWNTAGDKTKRPRLLTA
jgi:hypothetical protein